MEREKVTLRNIIRYSIQWKRSGLHAFNSIFEPIVRENVAPSVGVEKKATCRLSKKKKNSNCAGITKIKDKKIQSFS